MVLEDKEEAEKMTSVSGGSSTLNPNAPLYIPAAFRQVEDFSPEWWQLVTTLTWYHDYWLSLSHQDEEGFYDNTGHEFDRNSVTDLLPDTIDIDAAGKDFFMVDLQPEDFIQSSDSEGNGSNTLVEAEHPAKLPTA